MSYTKIARCAAALALATAVGPWRSASASLIAADNADNDPYPVDGFLPGDNGGTGFTAWMELETGTPGSMYTTTQIDGGIYSWGLSGTYALGRGLASAVGPGQWRFLAVHDPGNTAFSGFNLRSSSELGSGFADYELIRFGLDPSQPGYDGTGLYLSTNGGLSYDFLDCGWVDGAGDLLEYTVDWTGGGAYNLAIHNLDEDVLSSFSGTMVPGAVSMLGMGIFGATLDERVAFDDFQVIPEPASVLLFVLALPLLRHGRRRPRLPGGIIRRSGATPGTATAPERRI
jgi:hypothetical protein